MALLCPDVGEVEFLKRLLVGNGGKITGATNASPIVVTTQYNHGLAVNDRVTINDVGGNTAANGTFVISAVTSTTFTLSGSTGNGAYTSGGLWVVADAEDMTFKLRTDGLTPLETDTAGTYTEATFTGYSALTLTAQLAAAKWPFPTTDGSHITSSTYGTTLTWNPTSSQTVTGYFVVGAKTGVLLFAENFASSKSLSSGDTLNITCRLQLD